MQTQQTQQMIDQLLQQVNPVANWQIPPTAEYAPTTPQPTQMQPPTNFGQSSQLDLLLKSNEQIIAYLSSLNQAHSVQAAQQAERNAHQDRWNAWFMQQHQIAKPTTDRAITRANIAIALVLIGGLWSIGSSLWPRSPVAPTIGPSAPR
jgi:hypothetical protein